MSIETCVKHNQPNQYICAKNECNQLLCKQCFLTHSELSSHSLAVLLSMDSKEFFLRWTEYVLKKIGSFSQIVTHMGYSKIFEMKLDANHPKGTVSQLNFQDIQKVAIQALEEHKKITEGNLMFIRGTSHVEEMLHPEFLKDLYNIVCEDARFNLDILLNNFRKKLVESYPGKEIYNFAKFNIIPKEILQMEDERMKLFREFEDRIVLKGSGKGGSLVKSVGPLTSSPKKEEPVIGQLARSHSPRSTKQFLHSASQKSLIPPMTPEIRKSESRSSSSKQLNEPNNLSTLSIPSTTPKDINEITTKESLNGQKPTYEQLQITVSLLRSNDEMYQQKIVTLQNRVGFLRNQVERLTPLEKRVKQLEEEKLSTPTKPEQRAANEITRQVELQLRKQVEEMQKVQNNLIEQNRKINLTLKDLEDIAEGRSRTIMELQEELKTQSQNIQLKQKSIQQLNQLISNEEEEIAYRQNEVEILGQEIKKLMDKIAFLEKSIHQLNNLVSNEEEQISYRENEVQTLQQEINKLLARIRQLQNSVKSLNALISNEQDQLAYRQNESEILQKEVKKLLDKIGGLEKSIRELNNLISNEQEELNYREDEAERLTKQVRELIQKNKTFESELNEVREKNNILQTEVNGFVAIVKGLETELNQTKSRNSLLQNDLNSKKANTEELQSKLNDTSQKSQFTSDQLQNLVQRNNLLENELRISEEKGKILETEIQLMNEEYQLLEKEMNTINQKNKTQQILLKAQNQKDQWSNAQISAIKTELLSTKVQLNKSLQQNDRLRQQLSSHSTESLNQQLVEQVVVLEAELRCKTDDINLMFSVVQDYINKLGMNQSEFLVDKLKKLKTVNLGHRL